MNQPDVLPRCVDQLRSLKFPNIREGGFYYTNGAIHFSRGLLFQKYICLEWELFFQLSVCTHSRSVLADRVCHHYAISLSLLSKHSVYFYSSHSAVHVKVPEGACRDSKDLCPSPATAQELLLSLLLRSFMVLHVGSCLTSTGSEFPNQNMILSH